MSDKKSDRNRFANFSLATDQRGNLTCVALTKDGRLFMLQGHPKQTKDPARTWIRMADAPDDGADSSVS